MKTHFEIEDTDGDRLRIEDAFEEGTLLMVTSEDNIRNERVSVYLTKDDARTIRDLLDELLGDSRKASPETLAEARSLLIQVGKDLIRKGAPEVPEGDVVVFLGS